MTSQRVIILLTVKIVEINFIIMSLLKDANRFLPRIFVTFSHPTSPIKG